MNRTLRIQFVDGDGVILVVSEVEDCGDTTVYRLEWYGDTVYFEADCNATATELGETAIGALSAARVTNVTEV